jgi:hypothetical protein
VTTTLKVPNFNIDNVFLNILEESSSSANETPLIKENLPIEKRVSLLLVRDLFRLGWHMQSNSNKSLELLPPMNYEKNIIKAAMSYSRNEIILANRDWIQNHTDLAKSNLASGNDVLKSKIQPRIEICENEDQHNLFRMYRYYWSSPSSDYVGRRIRILVRDDGIKNSPVIGIAALGSSIIHIPNRDKWIGWDKETRSNRIIYVMDAYVIGALPPYNYLLGGKLVSYVLASNELRDMYKKKYLKTKTIIKKRKASDLALIMTTSLYGQTSSQYNRLKYGKTLLYKPIGTTSGFGSLHISSDTFGAMLQLTQENHYDISNSFGDGPNWRMRVIRAACDIMGLDSNVILQHSFQRGLYAIPLTRNFRAFLKGESDVPLYRDIPLDKIGEYWRNRWLINRKQNEKVIQDVKLFSPEKFSIEYTARE